uniref:Transmembrane protein n=1 Tax=Arundo donax TaxID=35708 RepID=A0A0A9DC88_ARUDO
MLLLLFVMRRHVFGLHACYSLLLPWLFVRLLLRPQRLPQWRALLRLEGVVVFIASTVIWMDMWRIIVTRRKRLRLRLVVVVVLHRVAVVLVVLVLEVLRGVLLVLRHWRSSCCFVALLPLHLLELLVLLLRFLHR